MIVIAALEDEYPILKNGFERRFEKSGHGCTSAPVTLLQSHLATNLFSNVEDEKFSIRREMLVRIARLCCSFLISLFANPIVITRYRSRPISSCVFEGQVILPFNIFLISFFFSLIY